MDKVATRPSAVHVICALLSSRSEVDIKDLTTMQVVNVHFIFMHIGEKSSLLGDSSRCEHTFSVCLCEFVVLSQPIRHPTSIKSFSESVGQA